VAESEESKESSGSEAAELMLLHDKLKFTGSEDEAFDCLCQALKILENDPENVALYSRGLEMLARDLKERGEITNAKRALEESIAVARSKMSSDPEVELIHIQEYSKMLAKEGKLRESSAVERDFILRAYEYLKRLDTIVSTLDETEQVRRAQDVKRLSKLTVDAIANRFGIGSDQHLYSLLLRAKMLYVLGDVPEAIMILNDGMDAAKPNLNRKSYLLLLEAAVDLHTRQEDYPMAEKMAYREMDVIEKLFGKQSDPMANCLANLARLYRSQKELKKAEEFMEQAVAIDGSTNIADATQKTDRLLTLIDIIIQQNDYKKAVNVCRKGIATVEKMHGEPHKKLPDLYVRLGELYLQMKRMDEAEAAVIKGITLIGVFGDVRNPMHRRGLNDLIKLYEKTGDDEKRKAVLANPLFKGRA